MAGDERVLFVCDFDGGLFHKENRWKVINSHTAPVGSPMAVREACRLYERIRSEHPAVSLLDIFAVDELVFPRAPASEADQVLPRNMGAKTFYNHMSKRHEVGLISSFDFRGLNHIFGRFFPPERGTPSDDIFLNSILLTTALNSAFFQTNPVDSCRRKLAILGSLLRREGDQALDASHRFDRIFFYYTQPEYAALVTEFVQAERAQFAGGRNALLGFLIVDEKSVR